MSSELQAKIMKAIHDVTGNETKTNDVWVTKYKFDDKHKSKHQFLFFLKPECTASYDGAKVESIVSLALHTLKENKIDVGAVRVMGGPYFEKTGIMEEHYGVICNISKHGVSAITDDAKKVMEEKFKDELAAGIKVVGAHEFLKTQKPHEITPFALRAINDNLGTTRLAGGTYVLKFNLMGQTQLVLNAFHPYQLVPFTAKGHSVVAFECFSDVSWADLRNKVCGATDPKKAAEGSFRNLLLTKKTELGLVSVDTSNNGCHMSAGPLEAMIELRRFMSEGEKSKIALDHTHFGANLHDLGASAAEIEAFAKNPQVAVGDGKTKTAFDATEEVNSDKAAKLLVNK